MIKQGTISNSLKLALKMTHNHWPLSKAKSIFVETNTYLQIREQWIANILLLKRKHLLITVIYLYETHTCKYVQEEGMTLVIKAQEVFFSTIGNVHSTSLNDKSQVVLELVNPIALWSLWKQQCRRVFSNQTAHPTMLMQEIWSEIVATLKS